VPATAAVIATQDIDRKAQSKNCGGGDNNQMTNAPFYDEKVSFGAGV
jgi:hypothetical protein